MTNTKPTWRENAKHIVLQSLLVVVYCLVVGIAFDALDGWLQAREYVSSTWQTAAIWLVTGLLLTLIFARDVLTDPVADRNELALRAVEAVKFIGAGPIFLLLVYVR